MDDVKTKIKSSWLQRLLCDEGFVCKTRVFGHVDRVLLPVVPLDANRCKYGLLKEKGAASGFEQTTFGPDLVSISPTTAATSAERTHHSST